VSSGATLIVAAGEGSSGPSAGAVTIGRGGEGRLEILGAGTSANPTLVIAGKARVGQGGEGTLRVGAGGHFSTGGDVVVGEGSAGTILVDGGGLTITADSILGGRLSVGLLGGAGAVDVTSGGDVYVEERLFVGDTDGFGEMTIGAAGSLSRVRVVLDAHVGLAGSGVLGVLAQGRIEVGGVLRVHPGSLLYGNGVIVGQVVNQGVVAPGASPGTLTVEGDYTQDATGTLTIEVAGPTAGKTHDRLVVTGAATLDGPIVLQFMNGFAPKVGQTFDFVASPTAPSGAFSQVEVRGLEPGAQFATAFAGGKLTATTTATAKALPTVTIKANAKRTSERRRGRTTFTLTRLRGTTSAPLTVPLVVSGTALASVDYAAIPASVVIPAGRRTATIALTPIVDGLREPAETVVVAVRPSAESTHARASTARVAIVD
jgi:hypothetical protein